MRPSVWLDVSMQDAMVVQKAQAMEGLHIPSPQVLATSAGDVSSGTTTGLKCFSLFSTVVVVVVVLRFAWFGWHPSSQKLFSVPGGRVPISGGCPGRDSCGAISDSGCGPYICQLRTCALHASQMAANTHQ